MGYCAGGAHRVSITLLYKMGENVIFGNIQRTTPDTTAKSNSALSRHHTRQALPRQLFPVNGKPGVRNRIYRMGLGELVQIPEDILVNDVIIIMPNNDPVF